MNPFSKSQPRRTGPALWAAILFLGAASLAQAQSTAFTYNGRLNLNGAPVNGAHEMRFTLYDASAGVNVIAGPLPPISADVVNGLFTVRIDFGAGIFTGPARWLSVEVRPVGGAYTTLTPRQEVTSSPYSIRAQTAGGVADGTVAANQLNTAGIPPTPGQFLSYNGGNLFWSDPGVAAGNIWSLNGNRAYYNSGNVGIGTNNPNHRLSIMGGPPWTTNGWTGSIELPTGSAIGWQANGFGQRFGMGHTGGGFLLFRTSANPGTTGSGALYDFCVNDSGNVGIGTTGPAAKLEVNGVVRSTRNNQPSQYLQLDGGDSSSYRLTAQSIFQAEKVLVIQNLSGEPVPSANNAIHFRLGTPAASSVKMVIDKDGRVGIGSTTPQATLEVVGQDALRIVGGQPFLQLLDDTAGYARGRIQSVAGSLVLEPESFVNGSNPNSSVVIANSGNVSVKSLTIRGGADLAEPFEFSESDIPKGSVLIIDDEQPGKLKLSTRAYDTRVAGIVSGANGVNPGISLRQEGVIGSGQDVALSGRVYVLADAAHGAIKPGDLLTTSDTPGHAMKVNNHRQSQGAILGKAMSALQNGKGMVLVLVTLQ